jgi:uncharacterized protein YoxC
MAIALAVIVALAAAVSGVWVMTRLASLIRELMKVTTGLTGLAVQVGRVTESARLGEAAAQSRRLGSG